MQNDLTRMVSQIAEAAEANLKVSLQSSSLLSRAANAPQKVSPAAVVSMASTLNASMCFSMGMFHFSQKFISNENTPAIIVMFSVPS